MNNIEIKPVDQYKSTMEEYTNDIVFRILFDEFTNVYEATGYFVGEDNSDIQGSVEARCMKTGEDEEKILQMIDKKLAVFGYGR